MSLAVLVDGGGESIHCVEAVSDMYRPCVCDPVEQQINVYYDKLRYMNIASDILLSSSAAHRSRRTHYMTVLNPYKRSQIRI